MGPLGDSWQMGILEVHDSTNPDNGYMETKEITEGFALHRQEALFPKT